METLKNYLKTSGWTIEKLAEAVGVHYSTLHRAMNNETELRSSTIVRLADKTGIKVEILVRESGKKGESHGQVGHL